MSRDQQTTYFANVKIRNARRAMGEYLAQAERFRVSPSIDKKLMENTLRPLADRAVAALKNVTTADMKAAGYTPKNAFLKERDEFLSFIRKFNIPTHQMHELITSINDVTSDMQGMKGLKNPAFDLMLPMIITALIILKWLGVRGDAMSEEV